MLKALLTDIDGTVTDPSRRLNTAAVEVMRSLVDDGVPVVLASGNTACFMDALCRIIGTSGTFIAENGGVLRIGFDGTLHLKGDQSVCRRALETVQEYYRSQGKEILLLSPTYRFTDLAFARTVPAAEIRTLLRDQAVQIIDTGYAIHLQAPGINKGTALEALAPELNMTPSDFLAIGDSVNDVQMLKKAGVGVTVANAHADARAVAAYVAEKEYGAGFVEAVTRYLPYFRAR